MSKQSDELREKAAACRKAAFDLAGVTGGDSRVGTYSTQACLYECAAAIVGALPSERERAELALLRAGWVDTDQRTRHVERFLNAREAKP